MEDFITTTRVTKSQNRKRKLRSLCAVYAYLIRSELEKPNPDYEAIDKYLSYIENFCRHVEFIEETPKHLEPYLIRKGECKGVKGVIFYKGRLIPKVALCVAQKIKERKIKNEDKNKK